MAVKAAMSQPAAAMRSEKPVALIPLLRRRFDNAFAGLGGFLLRFPHWLRSLQRSHRLVIRLFVEI
jgi:hypothetical protein